MVVGKREGESKSQFGLGRASEQVSSRANLADKASIRDPSSAAKFPFVSVLLRELEGLMQDTCRSGK